MQRKFVALSLRFRGPAAVAGGAPLAAPVSASLVLSRPCRHIGRLPAKPNERAPAEVRETRRHRHALCASSLPPTLPCRPGSRPVRQPKAVRPASERGRAEVQPSRHRPCGTRLPEPGSETANSGGPRDEGTFGSPPFVWPCRKRPRLAVPRAWSGRACMRKKKGSRAPHPVCCPRNAVASSASETYGTKVRCGLGPLRELGCTVSPGFLAGRHAGGRRGAGGERRGLAAQSKDGRG